MPVLTREQFKNIRRIEITSKHLVQDLLAGAYRSAFKGQGMEFLEVREYSPGDEVRHIDWNVTARMNQPFVKSFQEERELTVMLVVDVSASSLFGTRCRTKQQLMAEIGALLAFSANENNDNVGLLLFSDQVEKYLPPKKGARHTMQIIRELSAFNPKGKKTDIREALTYLGRIQRKRCLCFLLSDFICEDYIPTLKIAAKRYEMIAIRTGDRRERVLPKLKLLNLKDLETGETRLVDSSNASLQRVFSKRVAKQRADQMHAIKRLGAGFLDIDTHESYAHALRKFFKLRKRRAR